MQLLILVVLIALAIYYALKSRDVLAAATVTWGVLLGAIGFVLPLVLNHVLDTDFLHRFYKLIAFVAAPALFLSWIAGMRFRAHRQATKRLR
jgi:uncharacterized membrane protein (DUF441 family)